MIVNHWLQQKVMPLELLETCNDTISDTIKLKFGDTWITYLIKHSGSIAAHIPGIYASTAPCNLQYSGLSLPIISIHGVYGDDEVLNKVSGKRLKHHNEAQMLYIESNSILYNSSKNTVKNPFEG